jgi:hypothetical protein
MVVLLRPLVPALGIPMGVAFAHTEPGAPNPMFDPASTAGTPVADTPAGGVTFRILLAGFGSYRLKT